jgi:SAM-dependent methyltransferase
MNPKAMEPFGNALIDYSEGETDAELIIRRDDGQTVPLPVSLFFRNLSTFTAIEKAAIDRCVGHVLDIGAGTGLHGLVLRQKGLNVTAIDINPDAVSIMKRRGLEDVNCVDIFEFQGGRFDTLLMMGHGIGMVETLAGLDRLLVHARDLLSGKGRMLLDSLDVRVGNDPSNLAYHEANRCSGRYIGEIRMQFEFKGEAGAPCGWLHVDAETLAKHAGQAGWRCEIVLQEESGDYLAQLTEHEKADV